MPPKVLAKNNDRASGVLPVNAATRAAATKGPAPRLKLEIRRLPPGLTLTEFEETLGDEWKLGNGKVDWREYRQGKVKQSAGKVPEQSRCYLHVANEALVREFEARFLAVVFHDKIGTHRNPDLKHLPPMLGFAPNQRTPLNAKPRADNRQGTIDQDPEFIAFLEAETQPIAKPAALDTVGAEKEKAEKVEVRSTPLIEALREKKANKAKAAESKAEKKDGKGHARTDSKDAATKKDGKEEKSAQKQKVEEASKEAVKALNKQVANKQQQQGKRPESPQQTAAKNATSSKTKKAGQSPKPQNATPAQSAKDVLKAAQATPQGPAAQRAPRQRGNTEGIKKMLQKDLGIRPKPSTNQGAQSPRPSTPASTANATGSSTVPSAQQQSKSTSPAPPTSGSDKPPTAPKQQSQSTTHKAYLKHANPSQGMTEILIQQALSKHGDVANVTIDPRKGTAIALFKDSEGLKKALDAKRIAVANGHVEVLEFKDRGGGGGGVAGGGRGGFRGGRGGRGGTRGGGQVGGSGGQAAAKAEGHQ